MPDPDLELRGRAVIQTFRKGRRARPPPPPLPAKKNVFRPFALLDPPLNTFQTFRLISDTYFLCCPILFCFRYSVPVYSLWNVFSGEYLFVLCVLRCFVSINPSAAVSLSKFRKINLDAKKGRSRNFMQIFSTTSRQTFSKLQRFKLKIISSHKHKTTLCCT